MKKICGECKHYSPYNEGICPYVHRVCVKPKTKACKEFAILTNGDKIIAGGNRALAEIFDDIYNGNKCKYCINHAGSSICKLIPMSNSEYDEGYLDDDVCLDGFEAWLNAPAESEGEDEP